MGQGIEPIKREVFGTRGEGQGGEGRGEEGQREGADTESCLSLSSSAISVPLW